MTSDVVTAGSGAVGATTIASLGPDAVDRPAEQRADPVVSRGRRAATVVVAVLGCVFTGLCLLVLFASWRDDAAIDAHLGRADADVLSVAFNRTAVRFVSPEGVVYTPSQGVLYPGGLTAGERVRVEYDQANPELARLAGRDARLAVLPVGAAIAVTWALAGPALWWLRRRD